VLFSSGALVRYQDNCPQKERWFFIEKVFEEKQSASGALACEQKPVCRQPAGRAGQALGKVPFLHSTSWLNYLR